MCARSARGTVCLSDASPAPAGGPAVFGPTEAPCQTDQFLHGDLRNAGLRDWNDQIIVRLNIFIFIMKPNNHNHEAQQS